MTWKTPFDIETTGNVNATGSINANSFTDTEDLLSEAVLWLDADYSGGGQTIKNLGRGGRQLDAQNGSTSGEDSNDAKFLNWPGDNAGNYIYTSGSGNYLSVPDEAALDITGDIDLRVYVAMDDWTPSGAVRLISKWGSSGTSTLQYNFVLLTDGRLSLVWSEDGSATKFPSSTVAVSASNFEPLWVRATLDVNNGAGGHDVKFFTSEDNVTWSQLGATVTTAGTTSIHASTPPLFVHETAVGKVYRAQVLDGIEGTTVLDVDTSVITSGSATSFTALTGQAVTINRSTSGRKSVAVVSPVWLFGTDDYWEIANNPLFGSGPEEDLSVLIVVRQWDTPPSSGTLISSTIPGVGLDRIGFNVRSLTTTYRHQSYLQDVDTSATTVIDASLAYGSGDTAVLGFIVNRSTDELLNFSGRGIDTTGADISGVDDAAGGNVLRVARVSQGGGVYTDMEVLGVAVFPRALSASEIASINSYYQNRLS